MVKGNEEFLEKKALTSAVDDLLESFAGGELSGAFEDGIMTVA